VNHFKNSTAKTQLNDQNQSINANKRARKCHHLPHSVKRSGISAPFDILLNRRLDRRSQPPANLSASVEANDEIQEEVGVVPITRFSGHLEDRLSLFDLVDLKLTMWMGVQMSGVMVVGREESWVGPTVR